MTRTLLVVAASLMVASAAWAMDAPIQPGGGNNVSGALKNAPAPAATPSTIPDHAGPINAPIQPGGGNDVNAQFKPAPAPAPAPTTTSVSRGPINAPIQPGGGNDVNAQFKSAPAATPAAATNVSHVPFNAGSYNTASECMTAAEAAHQPLGQCETLRK